MCNSVEYCGEIPVYHKTRHGQFCPNVWSSIFLLVKKAKNQTGKINDDHWALKPTD